MALLDARGQFWALWGGYSPKIFDGDFLKIQQEFIKTKLKGAVILADNHFSYGQMGFRSVKFITTLSRPRGHTTTPLKAGQATPVGIFDALKKAWHEDEEQQNACVWTAVGICNKRLQ